MPIYFSFLELNKFKLFHSLSSEIKKKSKYGNTFLDIY